jgi:hypothetical protein
MAKTTSSNKKTTKSSLKPVAGGGNDHPHPPVLEVKCSYGGVEYSGGATVSMPKPGGGTQVKTCNDNTGRWD